MHRNTGQIYKHLLSLIFPQFPCVVIRWLFWKWVELLCDLRAWDVQSFQSVSEAIRYIRKNQPSELTIENVKFKPTELPT